MKVPEKQPGGKFADLAAIGKPLADAAEQMAGVPLGGEGGEMGTGELPLGEGEVEGAPAGGDIQPLVDKLSVTPEHAQALLDAASATEQYAQLSADALADLLAGDAEARADLERRVEADKGAPPAPEEAAPGDMPPGEGEEGMMSPGDVSSDGNALWPGAPGTQGGAESPLEKGKKGKDEDMTYGPGQAKWPR